MGIQTVLLSISWGMSNLSNVKSNQIASQWDVKTTSRPELTFLDKEQSIVVSNLGVPWFEVEKFDERNDYVLWEQPITIVLVAMGLSKVLKPQPDDVDYDNWNDI